MSAYRCPVCEYVYDEAKGDARKDFRRAPVGLMCRTTGAARTAV